MGGGARGRRGGQVAATCSPGVRRRAAQAVCPITRAANAPGSDAGPGWIDHSSRADGRGGPRESWTISGPRICRTIGSASPRATDGPWDRGGNCVRGAEGRGPGPMCHRRVLSFGPIHFGRSRVHGPGDRSGGVRRTATGVDGPARGGGDRAGDGVWLDRGWGGCGGGGGGGRVPPPAGPGGN